MPYADALLRSLKEHLSENIVLDVRIFYERLAEEHKQQLLSVATDKMRICLLNVQRYFRCNHRNARFLLIARAFAEYDKVLLLHPRMICFGDICELYRYDMADCTVCADLEKPEEYTPEAEKRYGRFFRDETVCWDFHVALLNVKQWMQDRNEEQLERLAEYVPDFMAAFAMMKLSVKNLPQHEYIRKNEVLQDSDDEEEEMNVYLKRIEELESQNADLESRLWAQQERTKDIEAEKERFLYELLETRKSFTYRIGRMITFLPRHIRKQS